MKLRALAMASLISIAIASQAIPAKRVARQVQQPDGTCVTLTPVGDEFLHFYITTDCKVVLPVNGAYYYAQVNADGLLEPSTVLAAEPDNLNTAQKDFISTIKDDQIIEAVRLTREASPMLKNRIADIEDSPATRPSRSDDKPWEGVGLFSSRFPLTGSPRSIVILVEYQDVKFTQSDDDTYEYFNRLLNEEGFSLEGGTGSARDYFIDNSMGQFSPEFDLYGPITLPKNREYYGGNDSYGNDKRAGQMIADAIDILLEQGVDFSQYDTDDNQKVDNVYVFYAGIGEAMDYENSPDAIWPHNYEMRYYGNSIAGNSTLKGYKAGNVYINNYACGSELTTDLYNYNKFIIDGVSTFVHEFSHVLGLPDLYSTSGELLDCTPGLYSVLDQGSYNNNSRTPPAYSAFERNALGWTDLEEITGPMDLVLEDLQSSNKAYVIRTDVSSEFYLFENRQWTAWDKYLPYHGMLVWHIDYVRNQWQNNTVNNNASHQYVDLVEAAINKLYGEKAYPFPGRKKVTSFTDESNPAMVSWSGKPLGLPMTDITEVAVVDEDGNEIAVDGKAFYNVSLKVAGGNAGINDVLADNGMNVKIAGRTITIDGDQSATVIDIMGRVVATGNGQHQLHAPGVYLIRCNGTSAKVAIR